MARLTCRCLNISVFAAGKSGDWQNNPITTSKLFPEGHGQADGTLYEVNLDVAGIIVVSY